MISSVEIPDSWKEETLGNVVDILSSKRIFAADYVLEGIPFYRSKEIIEKSKGDIISNPLFITKDRFEKIKNQYGAPVDGDVLISAVGERSGIPYHVKNDGDFYFKDGNLIWFRKFTEKLNSQYLCYFLNSRVGQRRLESLMIGSAQKALTIAGLKSMNLILPPPEEQKSIAAILTAFDDKIELLQAQNKTLEELAQTIFKEWFGKYQIDDELPEGWRVGKLGDVANHIKENIKPFENSTTEYLHFSLPAYDNGLKPVKEIGEMIKSNKYSVKNNSFLVSKLNPFTPRIWSIYNVESNYICSTEFQVVQPIDNVCFSLIHCFLNSERFTSELSQKVKGTSSSHQRVNPMDIFDVELVIPNENDLKNFNSIINPLIRKKEINHQQIQTLTQTRDTLLPKLMSGEIRVKM